MAAVRTTDALVAAVSVVVLSLFFNNLKSKSSSSKSPKLSESKKKSRQGLVGAIGNTPLIRINSLSDATGCEVILRIHRFLFYQIWFLLDFWFFLWWTNWFSDFIVVWSDSWEVWVFESWGECKRQSCSENYRRGNHITCFVWLLRKLLCKWNHLTDCSSLLSWLFWHQFLYQISIFLFPFWSNLFFVFVF